MSQENETIHDAVNNLNPEERQRLKSLVEDVEKQKLVMMSARDSINGSRKIAKDDCGIPPKVFNKLVELRLDSQKVEQAKSDLETSSELYESIFGDS